MVLYSTAYVITIDLYIPLHQTIHDLLQQLACFIKSIVACNLFLFTILKKGIYICIVILYKYLFFHFTALPLSFQSPFFDKIYLLKNFLATNEIIFKYV